jgi:heat shock protein HtpX
MNSLKTVLLLGLMSGLLLLGGEALGGRQGLVIGLGMAVAMNFFSYFFSDKMALKMYGCVPVTPTENSGVYHRIAPMTQQLCNKMSIPLPKLWIIPGGSPNAFATGRNPQNASVAVSAGLLDLMNDQEVEGVIAHELAHVLNRDILVSSIAATLGAAITFLARMAFWIGGRRDEGGSPWGGILMMITAPIAAMMIQMAISRTREYGADATAAKYAGTPNGLMSALSKLESFSKRLPMENANPSTAHMFIINPLSGGGFAKLFSTHPPTEERIAALRRLAA